MLRGLKISPFGWNEGASAVGQDQEQVRTTSPMHSPMYGKALTFKGMMRPGDDDA
jgi:hypothetical protein